MKPADAAALTSLLLAGCVSPQPEAAAPDPPPMPMCRDDAKAGAIDPALLLRARVEAQRFSDQVYGKDCAVCAELDAVFDDRDRLFLHITSPHRDPFINTSAGVWLRRSDGKVVEKGVWHSCQARIVPAPGNPPPAQP